MSAKPSTPEHTELIEMAKVFDASSYSSGFAVAVTPKISKVESTVWNVARVSGSTPHTPLQQKSEDQPHAKQIAHAPHSAMRGPDKEREPVPVTGDAERPLSNARRNVARRSKGQ
jgi:hypothetical protein